LVVLGPEDDVGAPPPAAGAGCAPGPEGPGADAGAGWACRGVGAAPDRVGLCTGAAAGTGADTAGGVTAGLGAAGVEVAGVEVAGVETAGVETAGVEAAGVDPTGVATGGTPTAGAWTGGTGTEGTVTGGRSAPAGIVSNPVAIAIEAATASNPARASIVPLPATRSFCHQRAQVEALGKPERPRNDEAPHGGGACKCG
jgi:hypothetical protein